MPTAFNDAYSSLERARESLEQACKETDSMAQSSYLKLSLHAMCQAVRLAHRCYEVGATSSGAMDGGTQTWAKNELEDFMGIPYKAFARRQVIPFETMEKDCRMWLNRAKFFVDRLASESSNMAVGVNEDQAEWNARNVGGRRIWDMDKNQLVEQGGDRG